MPGIEGAECEDHDECEAGELGLRSALGPRTAGLRLRPAAANISHEGILIS